jgi:soluble lytic murein transglycosylase-like protein
MHTNVAQWAMAAVGAALISGSGEALITYEESASCVPAEAAAAEATQPLAPAVEPSQQILVEHLSRRYYIAADATRQMVGAAYRAAREVGLDPLLVLAVIAESVMGAKGLMQIIPKYHRAKLDQFGGEQAVLDPESNILVGSRILQEYVYRTGTLEAGLQFYNGAFWDGSAQYAQKVMAERGRLESVVRSRGNI